MSLDIKEDEERKKDKELESSEEEEGIDQIDSKEAGKADE